MQNTKQKEQFTEPASIDKMFKPEYFTTWETSRNTMEAFGVEEHARNTLASKYQAPEYSQR
jgi:hypothetical protein